MEEIWQKWLRVLRLATFSGGPGAGGGCQMVDYKKNLNHDEPREVYSYCRDESGRQSHIADYT